MKIIKDKLRDEELITKKIQNAKEEKVLFVHPDLSYSDWFVELADRSVAAGQSFFPIAHNGKYRWHDRTLSFAVYRDDWLKYKSFEKLKRHTKIYNAKVPSLSYNLDVFDCDVVIPFDIHNRNWLNSSVESILNQVNVNCLIHIVYDGYDGNEADKFKLPNVRIYRNTYKIGPYRSVNRLFNRYESNYIAIHDSDDIAMPNRIALSINNMKANKSEMFGAAMMQFISYDTDYEANIEELNNHPIHRSGNHTWDISPNGVVINGTRVMTVSLFSRMGGFAPYMMSSDCEFTTRCYKAGEKVSHTEDIVSLRRLHNTSLSRNKETGLGSKFRENIHNKIYKSYALMTDGFNPKDFGYLDIDLKSENETIRIW